MIRRGLSIAGAAAVFAYAGLAGHELGRRLRIEMDHRRRRRTAA